MCYVTLTRSFGEMKERITKQLTCYSYNYITASLGHFRESTRILTYTAFFFRTRIIVRNILMLLCKHFSAHVKRLCFLILHGSVLTRVR